MSLPGTIDKSNQTIFKSKIHKHALHQKITKTMQEQRGLSSNTQNIRYTEHYWNKLRAERIAEETKRNMALVANHQPSISHHRLQFLTVPCSQTPILFIYSPMRTLSELRSAFLTVQCSQSSATVKALLLEGIIGQLRQLQANQTLGNKHKSMKTSRCISTKSALQTSITSSQHHSSLSSEYSPIHRPLSTSIIDEISIQQLEERIIEKQKTKLQLNEQIENCEDDAYQMTKILLTKRECHAQLDEIINTKTIQMNKYKSNKKPDHKNSLRARIKSLFK